jgi:glycine betaine/proline transport system substrate-binding protein
MKQLNFKLIAQILGAAIVMASVLPQSASAQDTVTIGVPSWPGARGIAAILKVVAEKDLGAKVQTIPGTNPVIYKGMDGGKGDVDVHPDTWMPNQANLRKEYVDEKKTVALSTKPYNSRQGMCVPKYIADKYGVKSVFDLSKPEIVKLFDTDGNGKGEAWIGATGWAVTNIMKVMARDYGWLPLYEESTVDETINIARVDQLIKQQKPVLFHCYSAHYVFNKYELTMLDEPKYADSCYKMVQPQEDPDWYNKSKITCSIKDADVFVGYSKSLDKRFPAVAKMLTNFSLDVSQVAAISNSIGVEKIPEDQFAVKWVADNRPTVNHWLGLSK